MTSQYPVRAVSGCRSAFHHRVPLDLLCLALLVSERVWGVIDSVGSPSSVSRVKELAALPSVERSCSDGGRWP